MRRLHSHLLLLFKLAGLQCFWVTTGVIRLYSLVGIGGIRGVKWANYYVWHLAIEDLALGGEKKVLSEWSSEGRAKSHRGKNSRLTRLSSGIEED